MFWVFFGKVYFLTFVENQNDMALQTIRPEKLVHSGKKRAYPSSFFWYCTCGKWHNYSTQRLFGIVEVQCTCGLKFELDKSNPKAEQTGGGFFTENKTTVHHA